MDSQQLDCLRKAGRIVKECREWAVENIRPGVEVRHILETIEEMARDQGGIPAFPAQSSRNNVAAHYCSPPSDPLIYEEGDCVKVDIGVHVDGFIADSAASVDLSEDGRWTPLVKASRDALTAGIATAGDGVHVTEIGAAIERRGEGHRRFLLARRLLPWSDGCGSIGTAVAVHEEQPVGLG